MASAEPKLTEKGKETKPPPAPPRGREAIRMKS